MRLATENRSWGLSRILGELKKLRIRIARTTLADILERTGIPPSPKRQQEVRWRGFISDHMHNTVAMGSDAPSPSTSTTITRSAHQGPGNVAPAPEDTGATRGPVRCRERLGGLLKHHYRAAS